MEAQPLIRVGCAGWGLRRAYGERFPGAGSQLARYARVFSAVEIDTSFYRPHRCSTYEAWAASVPASFRFAVKLPRRLTHELRLRDPGPALDGFLGQVSGLGDRLGPLLAQLPPSLPFDGAVAAAFLAAVRARFQGQLAVEPRHPSWFTPGAAAALQAASASRVGADPAPAPAAEVPTPWGGFTYRRLHGSPSIYRSAYPEAFLDRLAAELASGPSFVREAWCIFDNTAEGAALPNALELEARLRGGITRPGAGGAQGPFGAGP